IRRTCRGSSPTRKSAARRALPSSARDGASSCRSRSAGARTDDDGPDTSLSSAMPANWPELTLAITLALAAAYVIADLAARGVAALLRAIIPGEHEDLFIVRSEKIVRLVIFLMSGAALIVPALGFVGVETNVGTSR